MTDKEKIADAANNMENKYRNNKACAFQEKGSSMWVELIESVFGTPEDDELSMYNIGGWD